MATMIISRPGIAASLNGRELEVKMTPATSATEPGSPQGKVVALGKEAPRRAFLTVQLVTGLWAVRCYEDGDLIAQLGAPFVTREEALFSAFEIALAEWRVAGR